VRQAESLSIQINMQVRHPNMHVQAVRTIIKAILRRLEKTSHGISVLICSNKTIQTLNRSYRKINQPTDVLSFGDEEQSDFLGDLAISIEQIETQALEYGVPFDEEFKRILIHGILHLSGYHHETDGKEEARMMALQETLLEEVKSIPLCYHS
jgi:probable rRNA maturation factor